MADALAAERAKLRSRILVKPRLPDIVALNRGFMRTRGRDFIVFLTIVAMVVANAFGPQIAYAAHHPAAFNPGLSSGHAGHDHTSHRYKHDAATEVEQGTADAGTHSDVGHQAEICCFTVTCASTGDLVVAPAAPAAPLTGSDAPIPRDDTLRTFNARAIDPPPRSI